MEKGTIRLERESGSTRAGYCVFSELLVDIEKYSSILHPNELAHYNKLMADNRKISYLLGRVAAKMAIGELNPAEDLSSLLIGFGVFEFPVVRNVKSQNIQVSISHCDGIGVALAFPEEHPMGIDLEKIDTDKIEAMKSQISKEEFKLASSCDLASDLSYTMIWTIKEAISKVLRTGLTIDLKLLEIKALEKSGMAYISRFNHFEQYKGISYHCGKYICSIVLPFNTIPDIHQFQASFMEGIRKNEIQPH